MRCCSEVECERSRQAGRQAGQSFLSLLDRNKQQQLDARNNSSKSTIQAVYNGAVLMCD
jgi:hypothetical protein